MNIVITSQSTFQSRFTTTNSYDTEFSKIRSDITDTFPINIKTANNLTKTARRYSNTPNEKTTIIAI